MKLKFSVLAVVLMCVCIVSCASYSWAEESSEEAKQADRARYSEVLKNASDENEVAEKAEAKATQANTEKVSVQTAQEQAEKAKAAAEKAQAAAEAAQKSAEEKAKNTPSRYMASLPDEVSKESIWQTSYYVDEFKSPTSTAFVLSDLIRGSFSNSVTNESPAYIKFVVDAERICFELFEYESMIPVKVYDYDTVVLKIQLNSSGLYFSGNCQKFTSGKRLYVEDLEVFKVLSEFDDVKFLIEIQESWGSSDSYLFSVPTEGFVEAYKNTFISYINPILHRGAVLSLDN